jgi:hypothetical protein
MFRSSANMSVQRFVPPIDLNVILVSDTALSF